LPNTARKDKIKHEGAKEAARFGAPVFFLYTVFSCGREQQRSYPANKNYFTQSGALIGGHKEIRPPG